MGTLYSSGGSWARLRRSMLYFQRALTLMSSEVLGARCVFSRILLRSIRRGKFAIAGGRS